MEGSIPIPRFYLGFRRRKSLFHYIPPSTDISREIHSQYIQAVFIEIGFPILLPVRTLGTNESLEDSVGLATAGTMPTNTLTSLVCILDALAAYQRVATSSCYRTSKSKLNSKTLG